MSHTNNKDFFADMQYQVEDEISYIDALIQEPDTSDEASVELALKIRHLEFIAKQMQAFGEGDHRFSEKVAELEMHRATTVGLWAIDRDPREVTDLWIRKCLYRIEPTAGSISEQACSEA